MADDEIATKFREKIKDFGRTTLTIHRLNEDVKTEFMTIAKAEFDDNYQLLLRELLILRRGYYPKGNEELEAKIDVLAERLAKLEEQPEEIKTTGIKRADGSIR